MERNCKDRKFYDYYNWSLKLSEEMKEWLWEMNLIALKMTRIVQTALNFWSGQRINMENGMKLNEPS